MREDERGLFLWQAWQTREEKPPLPHPLKRDDLNHFQSWTRALQAGAGSRDIEMPLPTCGARERRCSGEL